MNPKDSPTASERAEGPADERAAADAWVCTDFDGHAGIGFTREEAATNAGEDCKDFLPLYFDPSKTLAEAEETIRNLVRALSEEVNSPSFMGEPVLPARSRLAAATPVAELPQVLEWRAARKASDEAVHAYNAALLAARAKDEVKGFGHTDVNKEFQAMTEASNKLYRLVAPMLDALAASQSPRTPEQPEQPEQPILLWQHFDHSRPTGERMFWSRHSDRAKALADPDKSFNEACDTQPDEHAQCGNGVGVLELHPPATSPRPGHFKTDFSE